MNTATSPAPKKAMDGFGILWGRLWQQYNQQFPILIRLAVAANILTIVTNFFSTESLQHWGHEVVTGGISGVAVGATILLSIVLLIISIWGSLALVFAIAKPGEATDWQTAFRRGKSFFWPSLTTGLLVFVIVIGWTLLLIIPGIYFAGLYGLSTFLVIREGKKNMAALRRSAELIRGYWWAVFWRQLIFGLLYGFGLSIVSASLAGLASHFQSGSFIMSGILTSILSVLALPLLSLLQAVIYDNLAALKPVSSIPAK